MRQFQKFFTREIPLIVMEYWHKGEYEKLHKILKGATHFNPLFIRNQNGHTDVYYDINNPDTALKPLFDYFKNNFDEFDRVSREFKIKQRQVSDLLNNFKMESFSRLFNSIAEAWGYLPVWVQFGSADKNKIALDFIEKSYRLRDKFQEIEYKIGETLLAAIKNKYPKFKQYVDVISVREVVDNAIPNSTELKNRKNGFIYFEGQILTQISKEKFAKKYQISFVENLAIIGEFDLPNEKIINANRKSVKGRVAYPGFVRGYIRKLMGKDQMGLLKKGEILVSPMTIPDFLPAMKKAAAIVTDEGGVVCHAAIVARELKKPCIVGTKFATQILKDGDLVEVDADKGEVIILEND
ncbi:MAG: phosphoenolpyruvate synthase [Candidatus Levybacteria bacterium]|nr:phosphoenolpyruvate synthase [Candidatus Levybacteria bacterium]